ncbi:MAG: lipoate--protein ligase family protein [bacterium]|nr:lipoate--protein ligase family protein [bacterium]
MALDEALLDGYVATAESAPTLRLYSWSCPALSFGRNQTSDGHWSPTYLRREGIDLVRRPTGGLAVLHEHERTYSVTGSLGRAPFSDGVVATYGRIADALVDAMRRLDIDAVRSSRAPRGAGAGEASCFAALSTHEIRAGSRKLIGSAQARRRGAFLQHGSIPLELDAERLDRALGREPGGDGGFIDLRRANPAAADPAKVDRALLAAFTEAFDVVLEPSELSPDEELRATRLRCWKYDSAEWTIHGRLGARER